MINNPSYYGFVATLLVIGYFFWIYPEGMNRTLIYLNLQLRYLKVEVSRVYLKWTLWRQLNRMNKEIGLPPVPWTHKKDSSEDP